MSEQRVKEILARPSARSHVTEVGALFLLFALAVHNFGGKDTSAPSTPTFVRPCIMTLIETMCPK